MAARLGAAGGRTHSPAKAAAARERQVMWPSNR